MNAAEKRGAVLWQRADGTERWLLYSIRPLDDEAFLPSLLDDMAVAWQENVKQPLRAAWRYAMAWTALLLYAIVVRLGALLQWQLLRFMWERP